MLSIENKKKLAQGIKTLKEKGATEAEIQKLVDVFQRKYSEPEEIKPKGTFLEDIKSIGSNIKEDISRRASSISETFRQGVSGELSGAEAGYRITGQIAGGIGDVLGQTVIGGVKSLIPPSVEAKIGEAGKKLLNTKLGEQAVIALSNGMQSYQDWKKENPRFAANLESTLNIADLAIDLATIGSVSGVKKAAKETLQEGAEEAGEKLLKTELKGKGVIGEGIEKLAKTPIVKATGEIIEETGESISKTVFGLDLNQFKAALKDPKQFRKLSETVDRESLTNQFATALSKRRDDLSDLGKAFEPIRVANTPITTKVDDIFEKTLANRGIDFDNGVIKITKKSRENLSQADINKLENIYKIYQGDLDSDSFLNLRSALSDIADFNREASNPLKKVARSLRAELNESRDQIPGLKELDLQFSQEKKILDPIINKLYDRKTGELKDNAIATISNLDSINKKRLIDRYSEIMPDLEPQLNILKAVEGVETAQGLKVGDYSKGILRGSGIAAGIATGNPLLVVGSLIATSPKTLLILLDGAVTAGKFAKKVIDPIKTKLLKGIKLTADESKKLTEILKIYADDVALSIGRKEGIEQLENN
jgi:hypothetical protein